MTRLALALLLAGWALGVQAADRMQIPKTMPGKTEPPAAAAKPTSNPPAPATSMTDAPPRESESCDAEGCCPNRIGVFGRLFGHRRMACAVPQACAETACSGTENCVWQPIYTTYDRGGRLRCGRRGDCERER